MKNISGVETCDFRPSTGSGPFPDLADRSETSDFETFRLPFMRSCLKDKIPFEKLASLALSEIHCVSLSIRNEGIVL